MLRSACRSARWSSVLGSIIRRSQSISGKKWVRKVPAARTLRFLSDEYRQTRISSARDFLTSRLPGTNRGRPASDRFRLADHA